jgi:hypothetical protein
MYDDREAFDNVAAEIDLWESAARELPLPDLRAVMATWQDSLAESLDAFNDIYADRDESGQCAASFAQAIAAVTRRATATAIFALGLSQRVSQAAQQN